MLTLNPRPAAEHDDGKPKPPNQAERGFAAMAHLCGIFWLPGVPLPILALLIPFLILQFARVHSPFVEQHAVQAVNFQLLMGVLYLAMWPVALIVPTSLWFWWVGIGALVFGLWQGAKALNGWPAKYPLTLKLFK
ncbi:DUF4870 domain-containing protein [Chitinibacteraceae bacterium HSL-7]